MAVWINTSATKVPASGLTLAAKHFKRKCFITALLAVFIGGAIYVMFRPAEPLFFRWIHLMGLGNFISGIREFSLPLINLIPEWLIFSLPNGLWAFAYTLFIRAIWSGSPSKLRYLWFATIPVLVLGYELCQLIHVLPGTFCLTDILSGLSGMAVGMVSFAKQKELENTI